MLRFMFENHKSSHDKLLMKPVTFDESKIQGFSTEVSQNMLPVQRKYE